MATSLVIIGSGGHGREIADVVEACAAAGDDVQLAGFLDDDATRHGSEVHGYPVLGDLQWLTSSAAAGVRVIAGIGSPRARCGAVRRAADLGAQFHTLIHPTVVRARDVTIGEGVVITAGCVLTHNIRLGAHTHLNRLTTVGHDCVVGAFVHLAPGVVLSGGVTVGEGCELGTNACVIQNITIGAWTVVGAGAAVVRDLPSEVTAMGVPARVR